MNHIFQQKTSIMKRIVYLGFLFLLIIGCKKATYDNTKEFEAKIVGFDLNCSTCILSFPNDSLEIKSLVGKSTNNYYQTVNLDMDGHNSGQIIRVNIRKAEDNEIPMCITLNPSYNFTQIYVIENK